MTVMASLRVHQSILGNLWNVWSAYHLFTQPLFYVLPKSLILKSFIIHFSSLKKFNACVILQTSFKAQSAKAYSLISRVNWENLIHVFLFVYMQTSIYGVYIFMLKILVTSLAELDKMTKKMKEVQQSNINVVSEDYLDDVQQGGGLVKIMAHKISSWGDIVSLCIPILLSSYSFGRVTILTKFNVLLYW